MHTYIHTLFILANCMILDQPNCGMFILEVWTELECILWQVGLGITIMRNLAHPF